MSYGIVGSINEEKHQDFDEKTSMVPAFDALMGTCKCWMSISKDIGVQKMGKTHRQGIFQSLINNRWWRV